MEQVLDCAFMPNILMDLSYIFKQTTFNLKYFLEQNIKFLSKYFMTTEIINSFMMIVFIFNGLLGFPNICHICVG